MLYSSVSVLWKWGLLIFLLLPNTPGNSKNIFDGRQLSITPKDCTSSQNKDVIGTCMFNLECQKKSGTVIGACVDRFLFGACCIIPSPPSSLEEEAVILPVPTGSAPSANNNGDEELKSPERFNTPETTPGDDESVDPINPGSEPSVKPSTSDDSDTSQIKTTHSVHSPPGLGIAGVPTKVPSSLDVSTLLPFPLETFPSDSDNNYFRPHGNHNNMHDSTSESHYAVEYTTTLKQPKVDDLIRNGGEPTETPPRLSTFMYVDGEISESSNSKEPPPSTPTVPSEFNYNSNNQFLNNPVQPEVFEEKLDSDELFTILNSSKFNISGVYFGGSDNENSHSVNEGQGLNPIWRTTTPKPTTNSEQDFSFEQFTTRSPTLRPWAFSTYQVHTFKYPPTESSNKGEETTEFPETEKTTSNQDSGSGLVTWGGVVTNPQTTTTTLRPRPKLTTTLAVGTTLPPKIILQTWNEDFPVAEGVKFTIPSTLKTTTTTTTTTAATTTTRMTTTTVPTTVPTSRTTTPRATTSTNPHKTSYVVRRTTPTPPVTKKPQLSNKDDNDLETNNNIDQGLKPLSPLNSDLETNLDDFVNQVVQGLAGSLDNLDLDEIILQQAAAPSLPSDTPTLHPLQILSDPLFPIINAAGESTPAKPGKTSINEKQSPPKITSPPKTKPTTTTVPPPVLDYKKDCGVRPLAKQGRIVGGTTSKFGKWPWQALVREATWLGLFSKNKCGGVLISPKYVLTAAHCQPGFLATLTVVLGDFDLSSEQDSNANSVIKTVRRVIVHRDYNAQTFENDIALLELDSAVEYQTHIVPICLPNENEIRVGQSGYVTGWGRLKYGGKVPQILHEVDVPILNNTDCQNMFLKSGHIKAIRESFICAGYAEGVKDSCEGDSGGPLALQRPNGQWVLAGTVSHGIKCAYPNLPGVYMRMTFYKAWIKRVTGINA